MTTTASADTCARVLGNLEAEPCLRFTIPELAALTGLPEDTISLALCQLVLDEAAEFAGVTARREPTWRTR